MRKNCQTTAEGAVVGALENAVNVSCPVLCVCVSLPGGVVGSVYSDVSVELFTVIKSR